MEGRYCAIIPAFDAAESIGEAVRRVKAQRLEVVVVDDGSRDRTAAIAAARGALVISHVRSRGRGSALRTGFAYALREGYDGVITLDSDGRYDPEDIPRLIDAGERQHAGLVVGNGTPADGQAAPPGRQWIDGAIVGLLTRIVGQPLPDAWCGFRVIRKELLADVALHATHSEIDTELLLKAARRHWKIISVPVVNHAQTSSAPRQPLQDTLRFLRLLVQFLVWWK